MVGDAIVGRADEVQAVHRFLDRIGGEGCALVLAGGPGIGKTVVWQHALAGAAGRSVTRLSCRPVETEAKLAFAALADLLEPVADLVLPEIPAPQRTALEVALLRAAPEGAPPNPRAVATAVLSMLRRLTERGPLVLAIDDEQWLDRASAEALAFALRRLGPRPLGVLTTLRLEADPAHDALGLDAAFAGRIERRLLGPLSASALHHVIRQHLGQVFPRPTLHRLTETAGGNPFYALELARALLDDGGPVEPSAPLPVPATLADLMARRLDRLAQRHRHVLLLASAAAAPTVTLVHELAGARAGAEGLARATQARLVEVHDGRVRFAHPLLAAAVYRAAPAATRREVHRQLATVAAPEERARHLALAAVAADEAVARGKPLGSGQLGNVGPQIHRHITRSRQIRTLAGPMGPAQSGAIAFAIEPALVTRHHFSGQRAGVHTMNTGTAIGCERIRRLLGSKQTCRQQQGRGDGESGDAAANRAQVILGSCKGLIHICHAAIISRN